MKQFTIRVPDDVYEVLVVQAESMALSPGVMARSWLKLHADEVRPMYRMQLLARSFQGDLSTSAPAGSGSGSSKASRQERRREERDRVKGKRKGK